MRTIIIHKCPVCTWQDSTGLSMHIMSQIDMAHWHLKSEIINKYEKKNYSPNILSKEYKITVGFIVDILQKSNIRIRNLKEAVALAVSEKRQYINAYGISGFRKDLSEHFRSIPEANFARILQHKNISYKKEIAYSLYDENKKLLCTYFLDFLINGEQGFEIKSYESNGGFPNKEKIMLFQKQHPEIKLKVLFCSSKEWHELEKKYSKLIPMWETQTRNLRTNPELYT